MDIRQVKRKGTLEKKRDRPRIVRNIDMLQKRKYLVDLKQKPMKNSRDEPYQEQSPTEYALEKGEHILQNSAEVLSSGVYRVYKIKAGYCINRDCWNNRFIAEKNFNETNESSKDIPVGFRKEANQKRIRWGTVKAETVGNKVAYIQTNERNAEWIVNNRRLEKQFKKLPDKHYNPKSSSVNYAEIQRKNSIENNSVRNSLIKHPTKQMQINRYVNKPETVSIQKQPQAYFYVPHVSPLARQRPFAISEQIMQKKLQQRMIREPFNRTNIKRFTALQYMRDFSITAIRAVTATANQFILYFGAVICLIAVMFVALLSSLAASPFGILLSNEAAEAGTMPLSAAVAAVQNEFTEKLELLQSADNYAEIYISGEPADLPEVVAVFAVHTTGNVEATSADVISIDDEKLERLKNVFWDMTKISARVDTRVIMIDEETSYIEKDLYIQITSKDVLEQASSYHFSKRQMDALYELLSQKILLSGLIQNASFVSSDIKAVMQSLPENLELDRKSVVEKALSLVGKVNYFWGGKSLTLGWDDNWGVLRKVTAEGSPTTGTYRLYGLDCSGFIDWAFFNASSGEYLISKGGGVAAQRANCTEISLENAQVGDLVFYEDNSHAGIICGRDDNGGLLIVHCTSGDTNTVVITNSTGFAIAGRPQYYID